VFVLLAFPWALGCPYSVPLDSSSNGGTNDTASNGTANGTPDPTVSTKWDLWSSGTCLRGANIWQCAVVPEVYGEGTLGFGAVGPPFTRDDFDQLAALGANYVNISHPGLYTVDPPYVLNEDIQANLDSLLAMIGEADMFAVITFRTGPGRSEFTFVLGEDTTNNPSEGWFDPSYYNDTVWTSQQAQDAWAEMWRHTANRYQDSEVVVGYDLMCEPNPEEVYFGIWGEPNEFYPAYANTLYDWNQFYPDIVAAIREVDANTPILVQPTGYGAVVWLPYLERNSDARIVYTVHQYLPSDYTHQFPYWPSVNYPSTYDADGDGLADTVNKAYLDDILQMVDSFKSSGSVVVAVNEFGPVRYAPGADDYMDDLMDLFETRGMNHALWEWGTSWEGCIDNDAFSFRHGPDPGNHSDVATSDLIRSITKHWQRNTLRPSNVSFE
jgi:hypothetical protein